MNPQCPQCGSVLKDDYGMTTCPACGSMLMIDFEGQVQMANTDEAAIESTPEPSFSLPADNQIDTPEEPADWHVLPVDEPAAEVTSLDPLATDPDPLGLSQYADSEISQAKDGLYLYTVVISGIDSKEIRESLREAITDSRFAWSVDAVLQRIHKGELVLQNISPVKAAILVNRLKQLPVKLQWEQNAVTQMDPSDMVDFSGGGHTSGAGGEFS